MLWPLVVFFGAVLLLAGGLLFLSWAAGGRHRDPARGTPYESGVAPTGSGRLRLTAKFYLVALLFVIFDLEAAFLFAWAVTAKALGWRGYAGLVVFLAILLVGLLYEWREGVLDWGGASRPARRRS